MLLSSLRVLSSSSSPFLFSPFSRGPVIAFVIFSCAFSSREEGTTVGDARPLPVADLPWHASSTRSRRCSSRKRLLSREKKKYSIDAVIERVLDTKLSPPPFIPLSLSLPPFAFFSFFLPPPPTSFALRVPALDHRLSFHPTFCDLFIGDERRVNRAPRGKRDTPGFEMGRSCPFFIVDFGFLSPCLARSKENAPRNCRGN